MRRFLTAFAVPLAGWMIAALPTWADDVSSHSIAHSESVSAEPTQAIYTTSLNDVYSTSLADDWFSASLADESGFNLVGHTSLLTASKGSKSGDEAGCDCDRCSRSALLTRTYVGFEFLQWYSKDRNVPALVTTNGAPIPPANAAGELPGATILFGGGGIGGDRQAGGRLTLGLWLDDCETQSLGFRFYANEGETQGYNATSTGNPILARPYVDTNVLVNAEAAFLVAYPGLSSGSIRMSSKNDVVGGEVFARNLLRSDHDYRLDWFAGYQFNRIDDDLVMSSVATAGGVTTSMLDVFDVHNEFHGGELGLLANVYRGCWTVSLMGKVAVGNMQQRAAISGQYTTTGGGGRTGPGGLMAQPTNIGVHQRDVTAWSPEAEVKLRYAVSDRLGVSIGYSILYWNRVALAGDLVDRNINSAQITSGGLPFAPPNDPTFVWRDTDFWVQTINVGLDLAY